MQVSTFLFPSILARSRPFISDQDQQSKNNKGMNQPVRTIMACTFQKVFLFCPVVQKCFATKYFASGSCICNTLKKTIIKLTICSFIVLPSNSIVRIF